jgi:hypothetical protein
LKTKKFLNGMFRALLLGLVISFVPSCSKLDYDTMVITNNSSKTVTYVKDGSHTLAPSGGTYTHLVPENSHIGPSSYTVDTLPLSVGLRRVNKFDYEFFNLTSIKLYIRSSLPQTIEVSNDQSYGYSFKF